VSIVLNWSSYVIYDTICTITMGIVASVCLKKYFRTKYPHQLYLGLVWVWATIANLFWTLGNLFLSKTFIIVDMNCVPFEIFFTIVLADYIIRDSIDPWKLMPFAILAGAFSITSFNPLNYVIAQYPNHEWAIFYNTSITGTLFVIISLYWAVVFFYLFGRIAREAPRYLKGKAYINVFSMVLLASRGLLFETLNRTMPFLNAPLLIIAIILQVYTFVKYPQLAFTLAKKVIKLYVIDTKSGISVFLYDWVDVDTPSNSNHTRFSGMVHGINLVLHDALKRGNVDKIDFEHGVLLLERIPNSQWTVVMAATGSQLVLRQALKVFAQKFVQNYTTVMNSIIDTDQFDSANSLVEACFPFVPKYK
jgi:hypothetical protein